jgi:hypothetical protein
MPALRRLLLSSALLAVLCAFAGPAAAKTDPAVKCAATKLKVTGKALQGMLACHAAAAKKGVTTAPACLTDLAAALTAAFGKAEVAAAKAESVCPEVGDADDTVADVTELVAAVRAISRPTATASKCTAKKLGAAAGLGSRLFMAHAKHRAKPDPVKLGEAVVAALAALDKAFTKLDDKAADCQVTGDADAVASAIAEEVADTVCDDGAACTDDDLTDQQACFWTPIVCGAGEVCDFRDGQCAHADCCLMSRGIGACVVEIPAAPVPDAEGFCENVDTQHADLTFNGSYGPNCIGWRAAGFTDCF